VWSGPTKREPCSRFLHARHPLHLRTNGLKALKELGVTPRKNHPLASSFHDPPTLDRKAAKLFYAMCQLFDASTYDMNSAMVV